MSTQSYKRCILQHHSSKARLVRAMRGISCYGFASGLVAQMRIYSINNLRLYYYLKRHLCFTQLCSHPSVVYSSCRSPYRIAAVQMRWHIITDTNNINNNNTKERREHTPHTHCTHKHPLLAMLCLLNVWLLQSSIYLLGTVEAQQLWHI